MTAPSAAAPVVKTGVKPAYLAIGALVVAVIAGVVIFLLVKGGSGNSGSSSGVTFNPSSVNCANPASWTMTAKLPSSMHEGDLVTISVDGSSLGTNPLREGSDNGALITKQSDGSWVVVTTMESADVQIMCQYGSSAGVDMFKAGKHKIQYLDATGKVLAEGSYTATP